jgi:hypothetical protein
MTFDSLSSSVLLLLLLLLLIVLFAAVNDAMHDNCTANNQKASLGYIQLDLLTSTSLYSPIRASFFLVTDQCAMPIDSCNSSI